jgi:hypothetical protein
MAKKLTSEEYTRYKKLKEDINLDASTAIRTYQGDSLFPSRDAHIKFMQDEGRFEEARLRALRTSFGLPREVDYQPTSTKRDPLYEEALKLRRRRAK